MIPTGPVQFFILVSLALSVVRSVPVLNGESDLSVDFSPLSSSTSSSSSSVNNNLLKSLVRANAMNNNHGLVVLPADDLINSLRDRLLLINPLLRYQYNRKRSCYLNAGLSNNCDFKDLISATNSRRMWESPSGPGKKRFFIDRTSPSTTVLGQPQLLDFSNDAAAASGKPVKRMECLSGLPGGDCENSFLGSESLGQDILRPGGRNPGRR